MVQTAKQSKSPLPTHDLNSLRHSLRLLSPHQKATLISKLPPVVANRLRTDFYLTTARDTQCPPDGNWRVWLIMAGRGAGKTRSGAEWIHEQVRRGHNRIALVGATAADVRDVMVQGESGLLACAQDDERPIYQPSLRRLTWPNGAIATTYSADEPDRLRGPQHSTAWCDEIATWRYGVESWDMLMFGLRLGSDPRCIATTTPKPVRLVRDLLASPSTAVTRGTTYDNAAHLSPAFIEQIVAKYEGTRLGRQELSGELLEDVEGALWQRPWFDNHRASSFEITDDGPAVIRNGERILLTRIYVIVDPATTHGDDSDQTGIAAVAEGEDKHYYVLAAYGVRLSPEGWAKRALDTLDGTKASAIKAESNQGGEMVRSVIKKVRPDAPVHLFRAFKSKVLRAEPVALLYEQGKVHHVGTLADAEDQMCSFPVASEHDDILDAIVHGITELHSQAGGLLVSFI